LVNRFELTFPGKRVVLVCEILTKTSAFDHKNEHGGSFHKLNAELGIIASKLKPFFGERKLLIRLTSLDGLVLQEEIKKM
jgi:hypothetical protein